MAPKGQPRLQQSHPTWSCWGRSLCNNVRMLGLGAGMGHMAGVSIAVVPGLPGSPAGRRGTGSCWCHSQGCPGLSRLCPAVTKGCSSCPRGGAQLAGPFSLAGTPQARCGQCPADTCSVPTLPEPPPTAAPSPHPLWPFQSALEGADGWKGCCFLDSSPSGARAEPGTD